MILLLSNDNACILEKFSEDKTQAKIIYPEGNGLEAWVSSEDLEAEYLGFGFLIKKEFQYDTQSSNTIKSHLQISARNSSKISIDVCR